MPEHVKTKVNEYLQWNVVQENKIDLNIMKMFEEISFKGYQITQIDFLAKDFENLKILNLDNNRITIIENTPPNLEELYLNSNMVTKIRGPENKNLLHLGLSFNSVDLFHLEDIFYFYPNLFSLNLSHNKLVDLEETVNILLRLKNLKVLVLRGNPFVLMEGYKFYCIHKLPNLRVFDTTPIPKDDAKKKKSMKSEKMSHSNLDNLSPDISFDLSITVLGGIKGVQLLEEQCEGADNFEAIDPTFKSSKFWIQTEFLGETIKSDPKQWTTDFAKEEESGKTDFKINLRRILALLPENCQHSRAEHKVVDFNFDLYEQLYNGLWIELYEEYPVINDVQSDQGETLKRAYLRDGVPYLKTAIRGVAKIETSQWLMNPNLNPADLTIFKKHYFYKLKYKNMPEFYYENSTIKFKPSEKEAVEAYVKVLSNIGIFIISV